MFNNTVLIHAMDHASEEYPSESCGLVVDNRYVPVLNIAAHPEHEFLISKKTIRHYTDRIQAVIHSHPDGSYYPSRADMQSQIAMGVPWGIVHVDNAIARRPFFWGDGVPVPELLGRPFQHGITDCYSLIRDYFKIEKGIVIDEFAREWEWWLEPGYDLYKNNFESQKFKIVDAADVRVGDCFLAKIKSRVINHAGVYVGSGLILHQLGNRHGFSSDNVSCKTPLHRWEKFIVSWVRR